MAPWNSRLTLGLKLSHAKWEIQAKIIGEWPLVGVGLAQYGDYELIRPAR